MTSIEQRLNELQSFIAQPYAWPGGYPLVLYFADGQPCCAKCAKENQELIAEATRDDPNSQWAVEGVSIHWEGPPECCAHCNASIDSAYGDPEA